MSVQDKSVQEKALIFIEGDTEEEFYEKVFPRYLGKIQRKIINLHGNFNIYNKVLDKTVQSLSKFPTFNFRVYCFIDRESKYHNPPLDINILRAKFNTDKDFRRRVSSTDVIFATPMIEAWFFYDITGIFSFLKVPRHLRNPNKYRTVQKLTANDLSRLFVRYKKFYIKGKRCKSFIDNLDIDKIYMNCKELRDGIDLIISNERIFRPLKSERYNLEKSP